MKQDIFKKYFTKYFSVKSEIEAFFTCNVTENYTVFLLHFPRFDMHTCKVKKKMYADGCDAVSPLHPAAKDALGD